MSGMSKLSQGKFSMSAVSGGSTSGGLNCATSNMGTSIKCMTERVLPSYVEQDNKILMKTIEVSPEKFKMMPDEEFEQIYGLAVENLNEFIGFCTQEQSVVLCLNLCEKGSVYDVIDQSRMALSWDFRLSLVTDIAKGMHHLHDKLSLTHGHLTSKNCLISAKWTCRVADYGLPTIRRDILQEQLEPDDPNDLLWTAPELLRLKRAERPTLGTLKGDVYSFGIIVQELCYMDKPFGKAYYERNGPIEIIKKVKAIPKSVDAAYRPTDLSLPAEVHGDTEKYTPHWKTLMNACWDEKPETRTAFITMEVHLRRIAGGRRINAIDSIIKVLEVHTQDLEAKAFLRSEEVYEQKARVEEILFNMLPSKVVKSLKEGKPVDPESYEAVTLFVSDIISFTPLAASMSPLQVVTFLSKLYDLFDELIDQHDVYKVETVGDAYIVVSGAPTHNGMEHASAICTFALYIISRVMTFKVPDFPDKVVKLRVGVHSGPALAGVVGRKMPRYCLFGDSVLICNDVSSTASANGIIVSQKTRDILKESKKTLYKFRDFGSIKCEGDVKLTTYQLLSMVGLPLVLPDYTKV